jgi:hypothetical protein
MLDDRYFRNLGTFNYNVLLGIVMAGFVGFSALPLILYLAQCRT